MGDAVRETKGEGRSWSLAEVPSSSSSMDIRRRVRGRNVDAAGAVPVFEDEGDPLSAGMAMESRAVLMKVEQHRTRGGKGGGRAWHQVKMSFWWRSRWHAWPEELRLSEG
jgi:hypothetical protein